jgi:hypothetical protein
MDGEIRRKSRNSGELDDRFSIIKPSIHREFSSGVIFLNPYDGQAADYAFCA